MLQTAREKTLKNKKIPMRQCVGCKEMKSKKEMMRVLKTGEGAIVIDTTGKKNGRGAYLCKTKECLVKARKNKGLERSFKVSIPDEVYDKLEKEFDGNV
ncbi:MAG: YlxR family protein [Clostridium sp.]|nr:YlxR family protein [Clostridium sp.]